MSGPDPQPTATMSDVAKRAGVSITTVSHVVNRTRPVAAKTQAMVLQAAAEVGYVPNDVLRSLHSTGLKTVGLAMSAISNIYFGDVVHGVEQTLSEAGYSILLSDTHDEPETEVKAVAELLRKHVDAIILAPVGDPMRILSYTQQRGVPVIVIDRAVSADVDQVTATSIEPTALLVDHLAEHGHRRIAMIGGRPGLATSSERDQGYVSGLRRNGLGYHPEIKVNGDSTALGAAGAIRQLLALPEPPSAVVVANNNMTIGVLRAAKQMGIRIPADLAIACFDDFEWADLFHPGLTAIAQPTQAMGTQAAELVLSRLGDPTLPVRRVRLESTFMRRESCGCPSAPRSDGLH